MKVTISTLLLFVVGVSHVSSQLLPCHTREIELCVSEALFYYQSNGMPDEDEKITEWCETIEEVRGCVGNYSGKCMTPMQREVAGLFVGGADDTERQFCTPGSEFRAKYLNQASCLSEGTDTDSYKTNAKDLQVALEATFEVPFKDRFPTLCCGLHRYHRGTEDNVQKRCGDDAVQMLRLFMNMIFTELPKTMCQNFDSGSDLCKKLLPPSGTPAKGDKSNSQTTRLLGSVLGNL